VATLLYLTGLLMTSGYTTLFNWIADSQCATLIYLTGLLTANGYITLFNWIVDGQWLYYFI
jgi:hypothetical protein